jgi:hypothetical protein
MKRSFPIQPGSASAHLADQIRGTIGVARFVQIAAAALLIASSAPPVFAQMELTGVTFQPPSGENTVLRADFFLQQTNMATSFTQADGVTSIKATVNGVAVPENRLLFTKTTDLPKYSCAVLLLVDNTLANRPGVDQRIKDQVTTLVHKSLLNFIDNAAVPPFKLEIAAASDGNARPLATMGSNKDLLQNAAQRGITFDGKRPSLYLELKEAISGLSQIPADRKFVVVFSDGVSDDKADVASAVDVIEAALKANIHICSIGFPTMPGSNVVQGLEPLAEKTGGAWVEATSQPEAPSGHPHTPAQADHSKLGLPNDVEASLLKLMVSGGQIQVQLAGLNAPVDLSFAIQTQLNHLYTITHRVDYLPVVASRPTPTAQPTSSPTPAPTPRPLPPSLLDIAKSWLMNNVIIVSIASVAILAGLVALMVVIRRRATRQAIPDLPNQTQPITPPDHSPEPEPTPLAWLESLDSDQTRYPISKTAVRIGRKPDNDIIMKNDTISGHHAEILKRGTEFIIADLGSSNQVLVGGKQVQRTALQDGDIIELGEVRLRFLEAQAADPDYRTLKIS